MSGERRGEWQDWPIEPLAVLSALRDREVGYILIGGVAAVLQGSPLPTYDIDITPAPGARNPTALTDTDGAERALAERSDVSFDTPFGHVDVHHRPAGFTSYAELRRGSHPIQLEPDLHHLDRTEDDLRPQVGQAIQVVTSESPPALVGGLGRWLPERPEALRRMRLLYQRKVAEVRRAPRPRPRRSSSPRLPSTT